MQKKPRVDRRITIGKVAEEIAINPNQTVRQLAKKTWLGIATISRNNKTLEQTGTKDETIAYIVGKSKDRMKKVQAYFDRYLEESIAKDTLDNDNTKIIATIAKDDLARITVLGGSITDDDGGLKEINFDGKTLLELEKMRRDLLLD